MMSGFVCILFNKVGVEYLKSEDTSSWACPPPDDVMPRLINMSSSHLPLALLAAIFNGILEYCLVTEEHNQIVNTSPILHFSNQKFQRIQNFVRDWPSTWKILDKVYEKDFELILGTCLSPRPVPGKTSNSCYTVWVWSKQRYHILQFTG